ncbi:MAG: GtrA family protein [Pseudomonas sp.]|uniref:GtrA family protein n=1 Tax=Pseudomonas sp. TaxID=306 RepID=UPI00339B7B29
MVIKQVICFLISGGIAAGLNWGTRFLFSMVFQFEVAVVLAFVIGLLAGFTLMRLFVFQGAGKPLKPQAGKYLLVNLLALAQTLIISVLCVHWLLPLLGVVEHVEALAHLFGVLVPIVTSYFGHKFLTFR